MTQNIPSEHNKKRHPSFSYRWHRWSVGWGHLQLTCMDELRYNSVTKKWSSLWM